jgi:hypothetical protein
MSGFFQDVLSGFFGNDYLRDYTHAAKTFRSNSYQNAPKYKFLFHTYFNINPEAYPAGVNTNYSILVKDVKLPSFGFNTVQLNQYNRKRIVQTKLRYDPVSITLHDDNGNTINKLWYAYYTYYYADATKPTVFLGKRGSPPQPAGTSATTGTTNADYDVNNIYNDSIQGNDNWGYIGETSNTRNGKKVPFFKNITVFGFNQNNFTAYTLINPIITSFGHDTYNYEEGSGVMRNTMSIDYETVVYNEGAIDGRAPGDIVTQFGDQATYDNTISPIQKPGSNYNTLGPGGLLDQGNYIKGLLADGKFAEAAIAAGGIAKNFEKNRVKANFKQELKQMLGPSNRGFGSPVSTNRNILFDIPDRSVTPYFIGTASAPTIANPPTPNPVEATPTAGTQVRK